MMTTAAQLALGRILRLAARPFMDGDVEVYEAARRVFLDEANRAGLDAFSPARRDDIAPAGWNHGRIGSGCIE